VLTVEAAVHPELRAAAAKSVAGLDTSALTRDAAGGQWRYAAEAMLRSVPPVGTEEGELQNYGPELCRICDQEGLAKLLATRLAAVGSVRAALRRMCDTKGASIAGGQLPVATFMQVLLDAVGPETSSCGELAFVADRVVVSGEPEAVNEPTFTQQRQGRGWRYRDGTRYEYAVSAELGKEKLQRFQSFVAVWRTVVAACRALRLPCGGIDCGVALRELLPLHESHESREEGHRMNGLLYFTAPAVVRTPAFRNAARALVAACGEGAFWARNARWCDLAQREQRGPGLGSWLAAPLRARIGGQTTVRDSAIAVEFSSILGARLPPPPCQLAGYSLKVAAAAQDGTIIGPVVTCAVVTTPPTQTSHRARAEWELDAFVIARVPAGGLSQLRLELCGWVRVPQSSKAGSKGENALMCLGSATLPLAGTAHTGAEGKAVWSERQLGQYHEAPAIKYRFVAPPAGVDELPDGTVLSSIEELAPALNFRRCHEVSAKDCRTFARLFNSPDTRSVLSTVLWKKGERARVTRDGDQERRLLTALSQGAGLAEAAPAYKEGRLCPADFDAPASDEDLAYGPKSVRMRLVSAAGDEQQQLACLLGEGSVLYPAEP